VTEDLTTTPPPDDAPTAVDSVPGILDAAQDAQDTTVPGQRRRIMLVGSGELGRELVIAFQRLGAEVIAVDGYAGAPAHGVADDAVVADLSDPDELASLIGGEAPDYVVNSSDVVPADALAAAADSGFAEVLPSTRSTQLTLDREGLRRLAADELGLPTAPFWFAGSVEELVAVADHAGYPLVVKPLIAVPGEGQSVLLRADDIEPAWQRAVSAGGRANHHKVLAETVVEIDYEVTLLTVRSVNPSGDGHVLEFCEPIGHRHGEQVLESWQPQQMNRAALDAAKSIAARIVNALGGRGVFGVELLVRGDEVYFSDVNARLLDAGLVTLRSQRLSQFELHARAILGMPVDTIMISPGAAEVLYGGTDERSGSPDALAEALAVPESDIRVFGRHPSTTLSRHRLAVALATAPDVMAARDRVRQASGALRKLWAP
jgi:phosphoribosylglycinamide formyltransferase 2